jgi:hypothetical protein
MSVRLTIVSDLTKRVIVSACTHTLSRSASERIRARRDVQGIERRQLHSMIPDFDIVGTANRGDTHA